MGILETVQGNQTITVHIYIIIVCSLFLLGK